MPENVVNETTPKAQAQAEVKEPNPAQAAIGAPNPAVTPEKKNSQEAAPKAQEETQSQKETDGEKAKSEAGDAGKDPFAELKLPEKSFLQAEDLEEIKAFAKEKGLTLEQAKLLVERENHAIAAYVGWQKEQLSKERESSWIPSLKADKDLGGEKFPESEKAVKDFLSRFDTEGELQKALEATGLTYYPALWKVLARAGRAAARDRIVPGAGSDVGKRIVSDVEAFYGKSLAASRQQSR